MANITLNSHDLLGKLSIIKSCLAMIAEGNDKSPADRKYLTIAVQTTEQLITIIKKQSANAQNTNR